MRTYKLKVSYTFEGTVEVRAENREQAKEIVNTGFGGVMGSVGKSSWTSDSKDESGIVDYEFPIHPDKVKIK